MKKSITLLCALFSIGAVVQATDVTYKHVLNADELSVATYKTDQIAGEGYFAILATSESEFEVDASSSGNITLNDGQVYSSNRRIKLKGAGTTTYRSIKFTATEAGQIDVIAKGGSSDQTDRFLHILNESGEEVAISSNYFGGNAVETTTLAFADAGTYYLCSNKSGINVYVVASTAELTLLSSEVLRKSGTETIADGTATVEDLATGLTADPTYITFSSEAGFTISYTTTDAETVTVNAYAGKERTIVLDGSEDLTSFTLTGTDSQVIFWTVYTDTYVAPDSNEGSATATAEGVELTLDDLIYEVPEDDVTYIVFTGSSAFTVTHDTEVEVEAVADENGVYTATVVCIEEDGTVNSIDFTSFVLTAVAEVEVSWTVHTDDYIAPIDPSDVVAEYTYDFTTMTSLNGMFIANGGSALVVYFDSATNTASADVNNGDGILIYYDKENGTDGKSKYETNDGFDTDHSYGLTTLGKSTTTDLYFEINAPVKYAGNYITVSAEFCAAGSSSRHSIVSDELVAVGNAGDGLGKAESTDVGDYQTVTSKPVQISAEGTTLYILSDANLYYFGVTLTISKSSSTDEGDGGDGDNRSEGEDGGDEDTAISSIAIDNVVEVARYNILGQKIEGAQKGINIVKYSDGSTQKVLVK